MKGVTPRVRRVWAKLNDLELGIRTRVAGPAQRWRADGRRSEKAAEYPTALYADAVAYETPDYWYVRKIARTLADEGASNEVFFDLGSGKGRILCVMARWPYKKVMGIEMSADLCEAARANAHRMRRKRAPIEVLCADAATADLSTGTVFFLFNPFGRDTLRSVILNIERSLRNTPRQVRLVFYNPKHEDVLEACGWLTKYREFVTGVAGLRVEFWHNECGK
jgi:SAM-dependent methyltransferase